jgi:hypothetical protein
MPPAPRPFDALRLLHHLPDFVLNGLSVALGVGVIQLGVHALAGSHAAQLALSGAVCASLADLPNTVPRTWQRVSAAALLGWLAALLVAWLQLQPSALGLGMGMGIAAIAFVAMMTMAWGARAGAVSFAPILALVFTMAVSPGGQAWLELAAWHGLGALAYLGWSLLASRAWRQRYRTLALVGSLRAAARLLDSRAALLDAPQPQAADPLAMQAWIKGEAELAERLQSARDFVFAAADSPAVRRDTGVLLHTIDLRDALLASRLDLDLLGSDATGRWVLQRIAQALRQIGQALDAAADALRDGRPAAPIELQRRSLPAFFADAPIAADDARARLLPVMAVRLGNMTADVEGIHALLHGAQAVVPLTRLELQRFVAPEGWPLAALRAQMSLQAPVLRHALRTALALAAAYFLALALPWTSHPHWLVLSVAVVLRGNLEQTLGRRNARVLGTMAGCVVVLLLARLSSPAALDLVFLTAVAIAHSFVLQRYWLTATAGTVMALLQAHSVDPAGGFAIAERVADTLLGAALAWGFSYVLPSWERRSLPRAIAASLKALHDYAGHAMRVSPVDAIEQRLARRRAYDALAALATTLQRSAVEPRAMQLPAHEVAALIEHGQRLMAHLSMVRFTLAYRSAELTGPATTAALHAAERALAASLSLADAGTSAVDTADVADDGIDPEELSLLPVRAPESDVTPWLMRRLKVLVLDARHIRQAAQRALSSVAEPGTPGPR